MAWEKATYWMAVAVLAVLALNSFVKRHWDCLADLRNQSLQMTEDVSGRATAFMNLEEVMIGRGETQFVPAQAKMARVQSQLASMEVAMARGQAGLAKLQARRAQFAGMEQLRSRLICPRQRLTMVVPRSAPMPHDGTI